MSDTSQGPGWWKASDDKWYPPESRTDAPAPPTGNPPTARDGRAEGKAEKARLKAMRPWWKKKRYAIPLALIALIAIAAALGGGEEAQDAAEETVQREQAEDTPNEATPGRADRQREDQEVALGQSVNVSGYKGTVHSAGFQAAFNDFEDKGYVVADVTVVNTDDRAQPYTLFDWKIQTPNGQVIDPTFTTLDGLLDSGDLVKDGTVSGKVVFEVGQTKGDFFIIYKPDAFDAARGLWKVTV